VTSGTNQAPVAASVTPNTGGGRSQIFSFQFTDGNGASDIVRAQMLFATTQSGANSCLVYYDRGSNTVSLRNNANTGWVGPVTLGTAGTIENSQCIINTGSSGAGATGMTLTVNLDVNFKAAFAGSKAVFGEVLDSVNVSSGYQPLGVWIVP
jgi:hypothetical protein